MIERGKAFADAGASGFFVPRLAEPRQIERVVQRRAAAAQRHRLPRRAGQEATGRAPASRGSATARSRTGR